MQWTTILTTCETCTLSIHDYGLNNLHRLFDNQMYPLRNSVKPPSFFSFFLMYWLSFVYITCILQYKNNKKWFLFLIFLLLWFVIITRKKESDFHWELLQCYLSLSYIYLYLFIFIYIYLFIINEFFVEAKKTKNVFYPPTPPLFLSLSCAIFVTISR